MRDWQEKDGVPILWVNNLKNELPYQDMGQRCLGQQQGWTHESSVPYLQPGWAPYLKKLVDPVVKLRKVQNHEGPEISTSE